MPRIVITIDKQGNVTLEGEGYSGAACTAELRRLAEGLGEIKRVRPKPEFYQAEKAPTKERVR